MSTLYNEKDQKLITILQDYIQNFEIPLSIDKFNTGQSNPTYLITTSNRRYVLRSKPPGVLLKSAHQIDREYLLLKALEASKFPTPKALFLFDDPEQWPTAFYVMEYLDGRVFHDPALPDIPDNNSRARVYDAMNKVLADLHCIDYKSLGLQDYGKPGNYYERQMSRWKRQYFHSETDKHSSIYKIIDWLENEVPGDDGLASLVHGDFRLDNIMFNKHDETILGVLDWELSTIGHPYADIAYQCMQWRLPYQGVFKGLGGVDREAIGLPSEEEYVSRYCERVGISGIENWNFYLVFSFFRLAAILQGVYKRSLDGNASNPEMAKAYGESVPVLGELAVSLLSQAGRD